MLVVPSCTNVICPSEMWWNEPGAAATCGGSPPPIQCARWSCQRAVLPSEIFCQSGGAVAPGVDAGRHDAALDASG